MPDIHDLLPGSSNIPALLLVGQDESGLDRTSQAYRAIRRQIIDLTLPPGSSFTETSLAQQWQISKTPVREALARLRRDGLVTALPRAGYVVSPITLQDTDELCGLRSLLSGEAAAAAARNGIPAAALKRLEELSEMSFAYVPGETGLDDWLPVGIEFEGIMAHFSGNSRLTKALVDVIDELERVLRMVLLIAPDVASPPGELDLVLRRLCERDADLARNAMKARCERVRHDVLEVLTKSASVSRANIEMPLR
ncbi:GntR family transcriptional regulator [Amycolatopsis benzoatilytica]|uniref:GntR family transcriptional regulator n=1 Tax=Amycolatopsis benzoatilytica TaxID=346045 RepID=UPI0003A6110D|nr:GntR family transcriptional regulator [Amycolatopsis benzoatilytica]